MNDRRKEIARISEALEGEKEQIEKRLKELYEEDNKLYELESMEPGRVCCECHESMGDEKGFLHKGCMPF